MAPRPKPPETTTPPPLQVPPPMQQAATPNHDFVTQIVFETQKSVGGLEATIKALAVATEKHDAKLEKILEEMNIAKGSLSAFKKMATVLGSAAVAILGAIFTALIKHFHWF